MSFHVTTFRAFEDAFGPVEKLERRWLRDEEERMVEPALGLRGLSASLDSCSRRPEITKLLGNHRDLKTIEHGQPHHVDPEHEDRNETKAASQWARPDGAIDVQDKKPLPEDKENRRRCSSKCCRSAS